jgi:hypothetical protein
MSSPGVVNLRAVGGITVEHSLPVFPDVTTSGGGNTFLCIDPVT